MERAHGELHSPYTDRDNGADLQQLQSDRPGCRHCQLRPLQSQPAQRLNEHIGEGGEPEPELVRAETVTGSPVGEEFELSVLDAVLHLASCAVQPLIQPPRFPPCLGQRRDDVAWVGLVEHVGYGPAGTSSGIPANSNLIYEVTLTDIHD